MARRGNFLDGDDNFREQNLRFVRNDLEDNINQYFGGGNGGRPNVTAPPRDYNVVQPNPGQSELENRKGFFLQLGLSRGEAGSLAERSFCLEHFSLNYFRDKRHLLRKSRLRQSEADVKIVSEISNEISTIERGQDNFDRDGRQNNDFSGNGGRGNIGFGGNGSGVSSGFNEFIDRRAPSPPRNMDWNERKRGYPSGNGNDGQSLFRNERNIGDLNEFVERRRQIEMNQGRDVFDNFGRRSPQTLQFNDNRNASNDFAQIGSGRHGVGINTDDDEFRHNRGFGGRPDINNDFNRCGNKFNSNKLNDGYQPTRGIPNNLGGNNMSQNLAINRVDFGPGHNDIGSNMNALNTAIEDCRSFGYGDNSSSLRGFGIGVGGSNCNSSNVSGGNYRDGNVRGNNFNRNPSSLLDDCQSSGPSGNIGGNFRRGNNFNENLRENLGIGITPGGSGNNLNLNVPNIRGDFGVSRNNLNAIDSRDFGGIKALLPNPPNLRNEFGIGRDGTKSTTLLRAGARSSGGSGGMKTNLVNNSGNNRNSGGRSDNTHKANAPKALSGRNGGISSSRGNRQVPLKTGPIYGRIGGSSAPPGKRQAPPNTGPIGGRNGGNSAPPSKRQIPPISGSVGGLNESVSVPPTKRQIPQKNGPIDGRNSGASAPSSKPQVLPKSGPTVDHNSGKSGQPAKPQEEPKSEHVGGKQTANNSTNAARVNKPMNNATNTVQGKPGPNSNQSNKLTRPVNKSLKSSNKNVAVARSLGNVGSKSNSQDSVVRNTQRDNKLNTNNLRNPSQNNGNNINIRNSTGSNNNGNFASGSNANSIRGFWGSNSNQGPGNFGNNQEFGCNQGFDGPFNGNGVGEFVNQFGPGGYNIVELLKTLAAAQNFNTFSNTNNNMNIPPNFRNFNNFGGPSFKNVTSLRARSSKVNLNLTCLIQKPYKDWPLSPVALNIGNKKGNLPQPLNKSYAVIFYAKRLPICKTNPNAKSKKLIENRGVDWSTPSDNESELGDDDEAVPEKVESDEGGFAFVLPKSLKTRRTKWRMIASSKTAEEHWLEFWKKFKPYESKVINKLAEFEGQNINALLAFNLPRKAKNTQMIINNKVKWIWKLIWNGCGGDSFRVAKYMYLLKDTNFWSMLSDIQMARILIALQHIKNANWVGMKRDLILTWAYYEEIISCFDGGDEPNQPNKKRSQKQIRKAQNNFKRGLFHWMVKEAFNELKTISAKEWPAFNQVYPTL